VLSSRLGLCCCVSSCMHTYLLPYHTLLTRFCLPCALSVFVFLFACEIVSLFSSCSLTFVLPVCCCNNRCMWWAMCVRGLFGWCRVPPQGSPEHLWRAAVSALHFRAPLLPLLLSGFGCCCRCICAACIVFLLCVCVCVLARVLWRWRAACRTGGSFPSCLSVRLRGGSDSRTSLLLCPEFMMKWHASTPAAG